MIDQFPVSSWKHQLPLYIDSLNESGTYQAWQTRQADQAVRLYFKNYLKRGAENSGEKHQSKRLRNFTTAQSPQILIESFRKNLRLRNYAYRKEKASLGWTHKFLSDCRIHRHNNLLSPEMVKDFLAHVVRDRRNPVISSLDNLVSFQCPDTYQ